MLDELSGQVAIVSGGGSGIGRATCLELARHGACVAVADVSGEAAARVAAEVGSALACPVDVRSAGQVRRVVGQVLERWGRIDILVNSAGIYQIGGIETISEDDWECMLGINLKGVFLFCRAVIPTMRAQGSGAIVNVSSITGRSKGELAGVHYAAAKAGIIGLTMTLANQVAAEGIRANCVAPSTIDTPMNAELSPEQRAQMEQRVPMGRLGRAEEVASAIAYLASPAASYITGETLNVNGGVFMI